MWKILLVDQTLYSSIAAYLRETIGPILSISKANYGFFWSIASRLVSLLELYDRLCLDFFYEASRSQSSFHLIVSWGSPSTKPRLEMLGYNPTYRDLLDFLDSLYIFIISTTWWVSLLVDQSPPRAIVATFYGRLWLICSESVEIVRVYWVDVTAGGPVNIECFRVKIYWNCNFVGLLHHQFWLQLVLALSWHHFQTFGINFVWLMIIDEVSVPKCAYRPYCLLKSDLKWCIHLSRGLFLYSNYLLTVTAGGPVNPRWHKFYGRLRLIRSVFRASKFSVL